MLDDIDNLLDDAISAHEAKDFNAAAIKYTKILEQDSHHADANHNFGLLTIELGFKDEALIFLQTAINTNPNVLQYWVTCINTLINTERFYDAQSVLEKAHLFGYRDEVFEHLRHNLDLKQQQCETLIKLNQSDDVKASFDQTTLEICEDGYGDTSSLSLDEHLEPNGKLPHTEEPPIDQIQSLMELLGQQMFEQVIEQAQKLIKQYSNNLTLWNIMGVAAVRLGQLDHAIISFQNAINIEPNAVDAHNNLGNILIKQGKLEEAIEAFSKALSIKPDFPEAHNNMGDALQQQGKLEEAIGAFNKALSFKPDYAEACNNMGDALQQQGKLEEAIGAFNKALSFKPDYAEAYNNMGTALQKQGKPEEAIEVYNKALSIKPDFPDAHKNKGIILQHQGKLEEAIGAFNKALSFKPDFPEAYNNMGNAFREQGKLDEAIEAFNKAISLKPDFPEAYNNLGFVKLMTDEWKDGIKLLQCRWKTKSMQNYKRVFKAPEWDGNLALEGKTLLIWGEQGPGDMIIWSSCLDYYTKTGAKVIVECSPKLVKLLTMSFPKITVRVENKEVKHEEEDFDFQIPMETLFGYACLSGKISSDQREYIFPDETKVDYWKNRLKIITEKPCIGISWKSPVMNLKRQNNYADLSFWKPLLQNENYTFFNLQSSDFEGDLQRIDQDFGVEVINFKEIDHYNDLAEVAAFCKALDKTISIATTVAQISTAVGTHTIIPTWRQGPWNNILFNSRGPKVKALYRNTWEPWNRVFNDVRDML